MLLVAKRRYGRTMSAPSIRQGQGQPGRNSLNRLAEEAVLAPVVDAIATPYILLDWAKSPEFCGAYISNIIGAPAAVRVIEPLPLATATDNAVTTQSLLVLVKSWEPPLGELGDYLHSLSGSQQKFILPLDWGEGAVKPISANHLNEWRRFCGSLSGWQLLQLDASP